MESELVSGFMTEHAAVVFVFFFLAEYSSIVLMCILCSVLFFGGYLFNLPFSDFILPQNLEHNLLFSLYEGTLYGLTLGIKSAMFVFTFIWTRASFPRVRYDQLMAFCWTIILPILFAFIILVPSILYVLDALSISICLL